MKIVNLYFVILCFVLCHSCLPTPRIDIPQELKLELIRTKQYGKYVELLNNALDSNNPKDLSKFASVDYFYDCCTSSEHGGILLEVLQKKGDEYFFQSLAYSSQKDRINMKGYFLIGLDHCDYNIQTFLKEYPKTCECLDIQPW